MPFTTNTSKTEGNEWNIIHVHIDFLLHEVLRAPNVILSSHCHLGLNMIEVANKNIRVFNICDLG